jgi:hypothetical protein
MSSTKLVRGFGSGGGAARARGLHFLRLAYFIGAHALQKFAELCDLYNGMNMHGKALDLLEQCVPLLLELVCEEGMTDHGLLQAE